MATHFIIKFGHQDNFKSLLEKLENVLSSLIATHQTAYIKNRFIGEGGRLISHTVDICDCSNIGGYLVTINTKKASDSLDHKFILPVLKKFGFGKNFVSWVEVSLNNQKLCVINDSNTARCFPLQQGAHQVDPFSAYVFILCLEISFILIKNDPNIKGISIFEDCYLFTAYTDGTTFSLKDENFIVHLSEKFKLFSDFAKLKPNTTKGEIARIGLLKGVQEAVCGMRCTDLFKK